jgi:hypothetical protein
MITQNRRLAGILLAVGLLLFIPLVAMQFTNEVNWSAFDFVVMGILLLGTGLTCEVVLRKVKSLKHRLVICAVVLIAFFLVWAELAVGIFGSPFAGS